MEYEWDENKNRANKAKHGLAFEDAERFDWDGALVIPDDREDYGEDRMAAFGFIDGRICVLVHTKRGEYVRIISLRKVNIREIGAYEKAT